MIRVIKFLFLVCSLLASAAAFAADLSKAAIHDMLATVDAGIANKNAHGIEKLFSDRATITMHVNAGGQSRTATISKAEYFKTLRQGWGMYDDYQYNRSNLKIDLQGRKAVVSDTIRETITTRGHKLTATTDEEVTVELVNGKPLITKVEGYTRM
jgi:hypothetical protein